MPDVVLELPTSLRGELKEPLGPIFSDADALLERAATPVVAVGDVVTYHLLRAEHAPAVAFVDEKTEREAVDDEIRERIADRRSDVTSASGDDARESAGGFDREVAVDNPAGTITDALLDALVDGLAGDATTLVRVDGEEDLAALPAVLAVPEGASVVYGQPAEGMVLVTADRAARERSRGLIERMDGDVEAALALLD